MTDGDYQLREVLVDIRLGPYRLCIDKDTDERIFTEDTDD